MNLGGGGGGSTFLAIVISSLIVSLFGTVIHCRAFFKDFPVGGHFLKRDLSVR